MIILMLMVDGQLMFTQYSYFQLGESTEPWMIKYFSWVQAVPRGLIRMLPTSITWLTVGIEPDEKRLRAYLEASTHVLDALAHRTLGDNDEATASIQAANTMLESDPQDSWQSRLIYEVLLREAFR